MTEGRGTYTAGGSWVHVFVFVYTHVYTCICMFFCEPGTGRQSSCWIVGRKGNGQLFTAAPE